MEHPGTLFFFTAGPHGFVDVHGLTAQMMCLSSAWKFIRFSVLASELFYQLGLIYVLYIYIY